MKKIRVGAIGIFLILGFMQNIVAGGKTVTLQSGMQVTLEPDTRLSSVYIGILIDRSPYSSSLDTLLYFEAIAQRMQQILSENIPNTILYLPECISEHPYNWMEQSYLFASLSSELFYTTTAQIVQIFKNLDKGLNFPYSNISVPINIHIAEKAQQSGQNMVISRSDMEQFIRKRDPFRLFHIYFYGNFDALDILRGFGEKISDRTLLRNEKARSGYIVFKISAQKNENELKLKLPATTLEQYLALEYLADFVLKDMSRQPYRQKLNLEIRLPWSLHEQICSIIVPYAMDWQGLGSKLEKTEAQAIRYWYYNRYKDKIRIIATAPESYVFYKQISALYFGNPEKLFLFWLPETFPSGRVADIVKKIGAAIKGEERPE